MSTGWDVRSTPLRLNINNINMATTDSKLKAAILVVSETASEDPSTDKCIPVLKKVFGDLGNDQWEVSETEIVPDNTLAIQKTVKNWTDGPEPINLIVTSGGTGFATKDVTPEVRALVLEMAQDTQLIETRQLRR